MPYNPTYRDRGARTIRATTGYENPAFPQGPASDKAITYLRSLGKEREVGMTVEDFDIMIDIWIEAEIATAGFVSEQINAYKTMPKRPVKSVEPGYYTLGGEYYVVVKTKDGERTYAKRLIGSSWEYEKGAVTALGSLQPLSVEEASKWGHLHGKCIVCMRALSDPASVTNGIGPVCAKKLKR